MTVVAFKPFNSGINMESFETWLVYWETIVGLSIQKLKLEKTTELISFDEETVPPRTKYLRVDEVIF